MIQEIATLPEGAHFRFAHDVNKRYRNLIVQTNTGSSVTISGERQDEGSWKSLGNGYAIGASSLVEQITADEYNRVREEREAKKQAIMNKVRSGKRGRVAVEKNFDIPFGKETTMSKIAQENNTYPTDIYNYFKRNNFIITVVREEKKVGQRGKPSKIIIVSEVKL